MPVDDQRRATAPARRKNIIDSLSQALDPLELESPSARLSSLIDQGPQRLMLASADIDGLVSSMMLGKASGWKIAALIIGSERVLLHPSIEAISDLLGAPLFGVDVFSPRFPNASNHTVLWGTRIPAGGVGVADLVATYDECIHQAAEQSVFLNASYWAGIEGARTGSWGHPRNAGYRYPLGTAQLLLAVLEVIEHSPKMFDRQYLPWLIANCDGGVASIRDYPFNVPMWWSALAAAVGPASLSELTYQLVMTQRPHDFLSVTHGLRMENPEAARCLTDRWNLRSVEPQALITITGWLSDISGWPDPFLDGALSLPDWKIVQPFRSSMSLNALPTTPGLTGTEGLWAQLTGSLNSVYTNFVYFREGPVLGWMAPI